MQKSRNFFWSIAYNWNHPSKGRVVPRYINIQEVRVEYKFNAEKYAEIVYRLVFI